MKYENIELTPDEETQRAANEAAKKLNGAGDAKPEIIMVPPIESMMLTPDEWASAKLSPDCIIENYLYADLAQLVAAGGTGKTTLILYESVCIALGRDVWGLKVYKPGTTVIITAEDNRERLAARLREICEAMALSPDETAIVQHSVLIWDVTGENTKLVIDAAGNLVPTLLGKLLVQRFSDIKPVLMIFDPLVSFGAAEQRTNDNEQALVTAARYIIRRLNCCVRYIHHTGKANAREKNTDQYAGRSGSALPDGSRMTAVLVPWKPGDMLVPPHGFVIPDDGAVVVLARPKVTYAPPDLPNIWIIRKTYAFSYRTEYHLPAEQQDSARMDQIVTFLTHELGQRHYYTKTQLEGIVSDLHMTRDELRKALAKLQVEGRIVDVPLPKHMRQGGKKTFLCPADLADSYPAEENNRVPVK